VIKRFTFLSRPLERDTGIKTARAAVISACRVPNSAKEGRALQANAKSPSLLPHR
jgi:hypothetical protein